MTFNEILKEFDEQFTFTDNWGTFVGWYEQNDGTKGYYTNDKTKSFLKQSFIKYLQGEVERLEKQKYNNQEYKEGVPASHYMEGYDKAISDQITHITNQIKELDTSNN